MLPSVSIYSCFIFSHFFCTDAPYSQLCPYGVKDMHYHWYWCDWYQLPALSLIMRLYISHLCFEEFCLVCLSQGLVQVHGVTCLCEECYHPFVSADLLASCIGFCSFPGLTSSVPMFYFVVVLACSLISTILVIGLMAFLIWIAVAH